MFDDVYAAELTERYASRPEWVRPSHYVLATAPHRATQREWLVRALEAMPPVVRDRYIGRLRADPTFLAAYNELGVAAVLLGRGYDVDSEPHLGGLTPDFLVRDGSDAGTIVEVYTRHRSDAQLREERRWLELKVRARDIPVPVGLIARVPDGSGLGAPDSKTCIAIIKKLTRRLLSLANPIGTTLLVEGYLFSVFPTAQAFSGGPGLRARMSTPGALGWHDADQVLDAVGEKVSKYAELVREAGMRLVVVVAAEPESSFTADLLRVALTGAQSVVFNLDLFGPSSTGPHPIKFRERDELARFHEAVAGVGWLATGSDGPGPLTVYRVGSAAQYLPWIAGGQLGLREVVAAKRRVGLTAPTRGSKRFVGGKCR